MVVVVVLVVVVVTFGAIFTPWSQKKTPPVIQVTQKTNRLIKQLKVGPFFFREFHAMGT